MKYAMFVSNIDTPSQMIKTEIRRRAPTKGIFFVAVVVQIQCGYGWIRCLCAAMGAAMASARRSSVVSLQLGAANLLHIDSCSFV